MKNEIVIIPEEEIKSKIYIIRGKEVMLDSDLASLYKCKNGTKEINQAVKNNLNKFPKRYSWVLTKEEVFDLRSNFLTANISTKSRSNPRVFTEQGVAMLATIIKSEVAAETSVIIMDAFVSMRHILLNSIDYQKELFIIQNKILEHDNKLIEHDSMFEKIFSEYSTKEYLKSKLIFENQIYDSYSFLLDILNKAKEEIIIIDNYCDKKVLDLISKIGVNVIVISKNINIELIDKYQKQYNNLTIKNNDSIHDRFIIMDKKIGYHLGSSIKDIGKKCSYIDIIEDEELKLLIEYIKKGN